MSQPPLVLVRMFCCRVPGMHIGVSLQFTAVSCQQWVSMCQARMFVLCVDLYDTYERLGCQGGEFNRMRGMDLMGSMRRAELTGY